MLEESNKIDDDKKTSDELDNTVVDEGENAVQEFYKFHKILICVSLVLLICCIIITIIMAIFFK